jgi:hypothetical protein
MTMASISNGGNATVALNAGDIITVEPQEKATVKFENPTGTLLGQFNDRRTFGPYKTGRSVKIVSVSGGVFYEVSQAKAAGSVTVSQDPDVGFFWGTGAPTLTAGKGSLYTRLDGSSTSTRLYINTDGGTTWTNLTSAA